jgi:hypothetical protein
MCRGIVFRTSGNFQTIVCGGVSATASEPHGRDLGILPMEEYPTMNFNNVEESVKEIS